jgi:hypothetical protein
MNLHPIHYSLILNLVAMVATGLLAYHFSQPLLIVVALLLANHSLARFQTDDDDEDEDEGGEIGFLANIK